MSATQATESSMLVETSCNAGSVGWATVVGQEEAVRELRASAVAPVHAYLFLGPHGSGRWAAAKAFCADVIARDLDAEAAERARRLIHHDGYADLVRIDPTGAQYRLEDVGRLIIEASRSPVEGPHKVIVADRFHTANAEAVGRLLKTLEEPPESTIIVLLAEEVPDEQITIASRCVTVRFQAVAQEAVVRWLVDHGADTDQADTLALAAGGDLRRAEDLLRDPGVGERHRLWRDAPGRLDGSGATVAVIVEELRAAIDAAQAPIDERHVGETETLAVREEQLGTRGSGRKDLETQHKREVRRFRSDELRFGLATLARVYRERLVADPRRVDRDALDVIRNAAEALLRNPNEALLLQAMFLRLDPT